VPLDGLVTDLHRKPDLLVRKIPREQLQGRCPERC